MPIYGFICESCSHKFDLFLKMSDERPDTCPQCNVIGKLGRDFSGVNVVIDMSQPKTIGDLANKNTEDAVKKGELPKSALDWDSNRRKKRESQKKIKAIASLTQAQKTEYIMTGKMP
jgi:putative FmdB family regulatory protein